MSTESTFDELRQALFGSIPDPVVPTPTVIDTMVETGQGISDLVFSPGRPPQVERYGHLEPVAIAGLEMLKASDTAALARDLIGDSDVHLRALKEQGACDLS
jgi:twitching motility protein PilT